MIFWGFTVVGFAAYAYCLDRPYLGYGAALLMAIFGIITSLIWTMVNRGSKFWQEYWEDQITFVNEKAALANPKLRWKDVNYIFFMDAEKYDEEERRDEGFWSGIRFSPSRLIIALSDYVTAAWILIFLMTGVVIFSFPYDPRQWMFVWIVVAVFGSAYFVWQSYKTRYHHFKQKPKRLD